MPKIKSTTLSKTTTKKKSTIKKVVEKKTKSSSQKKVDINPSDFLQKENENQLKAIITKEFDKDVIEGMDEERAGQLIMTARAPWFADEVEEDAAENSAEQS